MKLKEELGLHSLWEVIDRLLWIYYQHTQGEESAEERRNITILKRLRPRLGERNYVEEFERLARELKNEV